jgi:hypothetical protein
VKQFLGGNASVQYSASHLDKDCQQTMSEQKSRQFRPPLYQDGQPTAEPRSSAASEQHGWDAYRKWLSRVSTKPTGERAPLDHSIYSWRGYHTWADKVRQNWKGEG